MRLANGSCRAWLSTQGFRLCDLGRPLSHAHLVHGKSLRAPNADKGVAGEQVEAPDCQNMSDVEPGARKLLWDPS